jgi:hypothetical protein
MKSRRLGTHQEIVELEASVRSAAAAAVSDLADLVKHDDPLCVLAALRFEQSGRDPLDASRSLNLVEQPNQTFTYLVSIRVVELLLQEHPEAAPYRVNLGTAAGSDVESLDGSVAAEVFAAVAPANNEKLAKDVARVRTTSAVHRYVFFYCPGDFKRCLQDGVTVVPVRLDRASLNSEPAPQDKCPLT